MKLHISGSALRLMCVCGAGVGMSVCTWHVGVHLEPFLEWSRP